MSLGTILNVPTNNIDTRPNLQKLTGNNIPPGAFYFMSDGIVINGKYTREKLFLNIKLDILNKKLYLGSLKNRLDLVDTIREHIDILTQAMTNYLVNNQISQVVSVNTRYVEDDTTQKLKQFTLVKNWYMIKYEIIFDELKQ